jgi:hypothetical protein
LVTVPGTADALDRLLDRLEQEPAFRLPTLTREELCALEDRPVLADAEDAHWWSSLEAAVRAEVVSATQRGLLARGLVRVGSDRSRLELTDPVRLVLAVRAAPSFALLAHSDAPAADRGPIGALRVYGIDRPAADGAGPDARPVLLESRPVPGVVDFLLARAASAAAGIADLLLDPSTVPTTAGPRSAVVRRLELVRPRRGPVRPAPERRLILVGRSSARICTASPEGVAGEPAPVDHDALVRLVLAWLTSEEA